MKSSKKIVISLLATIVLVFIAIVAVGYSTSSDKPSGTQQPSAVDQATGSVTGIEVAVEQGTDDPVKVVDAQRKLAKLFVDYRDAQLMTNGLLLMDPSQNSKEDYLKFNRDAIDKWKSVEADAQAIDTIESTSQAWSQPLAGLMRMVDGLIPAAQAQENSEVELQIPKWDQVEMLRSAIPKAKILQLVQGSFGVTAKEAQKILEEHYQSASDHYVKDAQWYDTASKTSQGINTTCKVGLFIGGAVITAGGTAVLTMPASAAIATGFGSSISAGGAAVIGIGGVDTALEINEQGAQLIFGDGQSAESFAAMRKPLAPVTTILAIKDLRVDGLSNPGNLYNAYDLSAQAFDVGKSAVNMFLTPEGKVVVTNIDPAKLKTMSKEDLLKQLPAGHIYKELSKEEVEKMVSALQDTAAFRSFGTYLGEMQVPYAFNGTTYHFDPEVRGTVSRTGEVSFQFTAKGSFSYSVQSYPATANYTMKGDTKGMMDKDGNIKADGKFYTTVSVDIPGIENLPPEIRSQLNGGSSGNVSMDGKVGDKALDGGVTFSAGGKSESGTWSAKVQ